MSVLRIKDKDGNFVPITTIRGEPGKSAYEQAKEGGYSGTEEEFIAILGGLSGCGAGTMSNEDDTHEDIILNEIEQLRADIDYIAIMTGVEL